MATPRQYFRLDAKFPETIKSGLELYFSPDFTQVRLREYPKNPNKSFRSRWGKIFKSKRAKRLFFMYYGIRFYLDNCTFYNNYAKIMVYKRGEEL